MQAFSTSDLKKLGQHTNLKYKFIFEHFFVVFYHLTKKLTLILRLAKEMLKIKSVSVR